MKIAAKQSNKRFRDMNPGDVFWFEGDYFLRTNDSYQAVNLETGTIHTFSNGAHVAAAPNVVLALEEQLR